MEVASHPRTHGPEAVSRDVAVICDAFDTYLDCLGVEFKPFLLIGQELLHVLALVTLQLDHLAHFTVMDDGAIAG